MKILGLLVLTLIFCVAHTFAQYPVSPKDWTPWSVLEGDWAEFYVITNFRGGSKTLEQLAKKDLKSLKVDCLIIGRLLGEPPPALKGVKNIRVMFTEYGKFERVDGLREESFEVPNLDT